LGLLVEALAESRRKLHFLLYGYVVTPDHWQALIWMTYPLRGSHDTLFVSWAFLAGGPGY
jgi:hypothetical protein